MNKEKKVFDKYWFGRHQRKLVWLANSWIGKYIFRFKKMGHYLENKIVKITPNSVAEFMGYKEDGDIELKEHFFGRNEYARKLYFALLPMWWAMHIWDWVVADRQWFGKWQLAPQLNFGFSTLTQYPGSIGTNNPVDGYVARDDNNVTWEGVRDAAGNFSDYVATQNACIYLSSNASGTNKFNTLYRSIFCFNTSSLSSSATISATVISIYGYYKLNTFSASPTLNVYAATPASTAAIANSDYGQIGTVAQSDSDVAYADWNNAGYTDITFNVVGRSNVSKIGISKFGFREASYDVADSAPAWAGNKNWVLAIYYSDFGSNMPKLVVTYTLAAAYNSTGFFKLIK